MNSSLTHRHTNADDLAERLFDLGVRLARTTMTDRISTAHATCRAEDARALAELIAGMTDLGKAFYEMTPEEQVRHTRAASLAFSFTDARRERLAIHAAIRHAKNLIEDDDIARNVALASVSAFLEVMTCPKAVAHEYDPLTDLRRI